MKDSLKALFLSLCLFTSSLVAQQNQKLDSLHSTYKEQAEGIEKVKTLEELFFTVNDENRESGLEYLKSALSLSRKLSYQEGEANAYINLGYLYGVLRQPDSLSFYYERAVTAYSDLNMKKKVFKALHQWVRLENLEGNFDKALRLSDKSNEIASELKSGAMLSDAYQRKSTIFLDKGNYKLAIEELLNASRVLDTMNPQDPIKRGIVIVGIGRTEVLRENYNASLPSLMEGLEIFQKEESDIWRAITFMEIGSAYYHLKEYDKSYENYKSSLDFSYKMKRDDFVAANLGNIGGVLIEQKKYNQALEHLFESNRIAEKRGSINNQIITHNDIASAYLGKKDYPKAVESYTAAIHLADSINSIDNLSDAYKERAETYEKMGTFSKALEDQKQFQILKDSVFNTTKSRQIEELKTQYETEKKEQQIVLQGKEITVLEQQASINNLQRWLMGGALLLSLLGFYAIRQKMKRNKMVREKIEAELDFKKKELTTHALHLAKKNEVLEALKQKAQELKQSEENTKGYTQLIRTIDFDLQDDNNWENFAKYFEEVHKDFNGNVKRKYPEVTSNELRLLALLKMNLSSKEIANILNISQEGIKKARYRLRKKLDITKEESLQDMVMTL